MTNLMKDFFNTEFGKMQSFTVGFNDTMELMREAATAAATKAITYPPYNIKQVKENKYVIVEFTHENSIPRCLKLASKKQANFGGR